jgi:hypothetical protein
MDLVSYPKTWINVSKTIILPVYGIILRLSLSCQRNNEDCCCLRVGCYGEHLDSRRTK